jgi:hypothetical protein
MKIYAVIGESQQTVIADNVQYSPQENEVLMESERPEGDYIATESGVWVYDISKKYAELDAEYTRQKALLIEQYTDDTLHDDAEAMAADKEEMAALDAWYDEEYQKIGEAE